MSRDRLFWLLLFLALALRLVHLNSPLIGWHSWRQADTAAIARNYFENGYRFGYPQIDWAGDGDGFCETEFPLYPFLTATLYPLTGVWEGWGRLISALCSLAVIICLHALVRKASGRAAALWSSAFVAFLPLSAYYSRTFMPESMMLAGSAVGVCAFDRWTQTGRLRWWLASLAGVALACLLKITSLYLGLPLLYLAWRRWGGGLWRRPALWLYATVVLTGVFLWYRHAYVVGTESGLSFGIWNYGTDKWGHWGLLFTWKFWNAILFRSLAERHLTWAGLPLLAAGLVLPRRDPRERLFDWWLVAVIAYFMIAQRGNLVHEYYQLPFLLPASALMGRACARGLDRRTRVAVRAVVAVLIVGVAVLSTVRLVDYLRQEDPRQSWQVALAELIQSETEPDARGLFVDGYDPTLMYLAHRKGWHAAPDKLTAAWLAERAAQGARFVAGRADDLPPILRANATVTGRATVGDTEVLVVPLPQPTPPVERLHR